LGWPGLVGAWLVWTPLLGRPGLWMASALASLSLPLLVLAARSAAIPLGLRRLWAAAPVPEVAWSHGTGRAGAGEVGREIAR
jgi:hypothetical protein